MNLIAASGLNLICLTFPATYCKLRRQADWVTPLNPVGLLFITFVTHLPGLFVMFVNLET